MTLICLRQCSSVSWLHQEVSVFLLFTDRALAEVHILGKVQPHEGGGPAGVGQAGDVRVRAVLALSRTPSESLVRGCAVPARCLPFAGRKGGMVNRSYFLCVAY